MRWGSARFRRDRFGQLRLERRRHDRTPQPQPHDCTPQPHDCTPQPLDRTPQPLDRTPQPLDRTPQPLDRTPQPPECTPPLGHTPPLHEHTPQPHELTPLSMGRGPATPALCYSTGSRHWWLWWPCPDCGGVRLPLRGSASGRAPVYVIRAAAAAERCPGCETRRRRSQAAGPEPTVWYDTLVRDWVVRLSNAAILPLELRWFDLPEPAVYRAASDLACLGDELD